MNGKATHASRADTASLNFFPSSLREGTMGTKTINCLLIDDSQYDRQRVLRISEQGSLDVSFAEAPSLDEALSMLQKREFDVILLDQNLPDGDGLVAASLLRKHLGPKAPPIIMVSGSVETAMPARAFASGCVDYISKDNLTIPGLEKAILGTIKKAKIAAPPAIAPATDESSALQAFADDTVLEMRIPLSRMLRLISRAEDKHPAAAAELNDLKVVCREMWEYLDNVHHVVAGNQA